MFINEYAYELVLDTNFYKTFSYYKYLMVCQTYLVSFIKKKIKYIHQSTIKMLKIVVFCDVTTKTDVH